MNDRAPSPPAPVSFGEALRFWLKLGFIGFGGPAGQIAIMHAELVERRRWISEKRFLRLIEQTPRTASVIAVEETTCFLLLAWEFTALLKEFPAMSDVLLRQMIGRLHRKEHHVF